MSVICMLDGVLLYGGFLETLKNLKELGLWVCLFDPVVWIVMERSSYDHA